MEYYERIIDRVIKMYFEVLGGLLIEGPQGCGKTTTSKIIAKSTIDFKDKNKVFYYQNLLSTDPTPLLELSKPTLIDEWEVYPHISDIIKHNIDKEQLKGAYILSSSCTAKKGIVFHSGAFRIGRIKMYPMSLYESHDSNGKISLQSLFNQETITPFENSLTIDSIVRLIIKGGWPDLIGKDEDYCKLYLDTYIGRTIFDNIDYMDEYKNNPIALKKVLISYSKNISTFISNSSIRDDVNNNNESLSIEYLNQHINVLKKLFLIDNLEVWSPLLSSKTTLRKSDKIQLVDPSIAVSLLRYSKQSLLSDLNMLEHLFESLVTRDLRVYSLPLQGKVYHYRDKSGLEIDNIISLDDNRWAAIQIRLSSSDLDNTASSLLKLNDKLDPSY